MLESIDSDFSAVNDFITEEQRRVKQIRRYRSSKILKRNLIYSALFLISLGLLIFLLSLAYWFYQERPKHIINIEGDEGAVTYNTTNYNIEDKLEVIEELIRLNKEKDKKNETMTNQQSVTEEYVIFRHRNITLSDYTTKVVTGWVFDPKNIDYPHEQYCYVDYKNNQTIWLQKKKGKSMPTDRIYNSNLSRGDTLKAKSLCVWF